MNEYQKKAWALRMELICESIKVNNDFDSEAINSKVRRILGSPPQEKNLTTIQEKQKAIAAAVLGVLKNGR